MTRRMSILLMTVFACGYGASGCLFVLGAYRRWLAGEHWLLVASMAVGGVCWVLYGCQAAYMMHRQAEVLFRWREKTGK